MSVEGWGAVANVATAVLTAAITWITWQAYNNWREEEDYSAFIEAKNSVIKEIISFERIIFSCYGSRYISHGWENVEAFTQSAGNREDYEKIQYLISSLRSAERSYESWLKITEICAFISEEKSAIVLSKLNKILQHIDEVRGASLNLLYIYKNNKFDDLDAFEEKILILIIDRDHSEREKIKILVKDLYKFVKGLNNSDSI